MIKIFYSNRIEHLYQNLKQNLFSSSNPFARRLIIVPTPAIKSWLLLQFAKDPAVGIAAGLEILYLEDAINKLHDLMNEGVTKSYLPNLLELTLMIDHTIREIVSHGENAAVWKPLLDYLKISKTKKLSKRSEKRLASLAETLAKLFVNYGKYGQAMVESWKNSQGQEGDTGWQQALWNLIFSKNNWSYPSQDYPLLNWKNSPAHLQVHLFSISFLSQSEYLFFEKMEKALPVHYYSISPCYLFWSDNLSDKEAFKLKKFWERKGVSIHEQQSLEKYLQEKNPLLANWGKLGRKMAELFESKDLESASYYTLPVSLQENEDFQDLGDENLLWEETDRKAHLLDYLQADILLMRNPLKENAATFQGLENDPSIQLHCAPTKQREVQILYHNLLTLIQREKNLEPSDIIVMAPDIREYAPYIRQIFGTEESLLDFQVMDLLSLSEDSLIKQFWHLIELPFGRWNAEDLMTLFNFQDFQKKHQISPAEVEQIQSWIKDAGILWGEDFAHRNDILQERYQENMLEATDLGTWEGGFMRLLMGLAMQETPHSPILPLSLEASQGPLLGKWIALIRSLKKDLKSLCDHTKKTYGDWILELKRLVRAYLTDKTDEEEQENLLDRLDDFAFAARWISAQEVSFLSITEYLKSFLNSRPFTYHENHLQAVRFCSMLPMRAIPAKVIALMGMSEGEFPRPDTHLSLNLMNENRLCSYCPSRQDYDRYLFLEALLSARQYFLLSYANYCADEGQGQPPSLLVTELISYIKASYQVTLTYTHPYYSFDAQYFSNHPFYKNYSYADYRAALSYYQPQKCPKHRFIPDFNPLSDVASHIASKELILDIKEIQTALHNPLKHYFNQSLGIYFWEEEELQNEEIFTLNALQSHHFKKTSLKQDLAASFQDSERRGKLPFGLFKKTALQKITEDVQGQSKVLQKLNVDPKKIFEIHLQEHYEFPLQDEQGWKLPSFHLEYKTQSIKIVGKFSYVSDTGLIAWIEGNKKDLTKAWGEYILFKCIIDHFQLPIKKQLLCIKGEKVIHDETEDPLQEFKQILDYYFQSLSQASPLISEWTHDLVHLDSETLQNILDKSLKDPFNPLYNAYIHWVCQNGAPDASTLIEHWQPKARALFSHLYQPQTAHADE